LFVIEISFLTSQQAAIVHLFYLQKGTIVQSHPRSRYSCGSRPYRPTYGQSPTQLLSSGVAGEKRTTSGEVLPRVFPEWAVISLHQTAAEELMARHDNVIPGVAAGVKAV
jgi:hypothetical protein